MSKKILIVTHGFYPDQSPRSKRATELAVECKRLNYLVTVLAPYNKQTEAFLREKEIDFISLGALIWSTLNLSKLNKTFNRLLNRILSLFFEYPSIEIYFKISKTLKGINRKFDLIISIAVPHPIHWGVAASWNHIKRLNPKTVWVADCGDPFYLDKNDTFRKPFYFKFVEKWFMKKANYITIPFEEAKQGYFIEFHPKIKIIPQGLTFPAITTNEIQPNMVPTFSYFGALSPYIHAYKPFFEFLNTIQQEFKFIIYTNQPDLYLNHLSIETQEKCTIKPYTNRENLLNEVSYVDFFLHFPYRYNIQRSLKLVDYAYLNKPVISYSNRHDDEKFNQFLLGNYNQQEHLPDYRLYDIKKVAKQFIELIAV